MGFWKRPWCWERLRAGGEGDYRGWDSWMASLTPWTWVWVDSGGWWWTRRPGVLWFTGSQGVGHDWATELTELLQDYRGGTIRWTLGIWWSSDSTGNRGEDGSLGKGWQGLARESTEGCGLGGEEAGAKWGCRAPETGKSCPLLWWDRCFPLAVALDLYHPIHGSSPARETYRQMLWSWAGELVGFTHSDEEE